MALKMLSIRKKCAAEIALYKKILIKFDCNGKTELKNFELGSSKFLTDEIKQNVIVV